MTEQQLLCLLDSGDHDQMGNALIYIEKQLKQRPSQLLINKLLELCSDTDQDIRAEAVQAAGYYWQLPEVFPLLVAILRQPTEDDLVLNSAIFAVGEIARNNDELRGRGLSILAEVALNDSMPKTLQQEAYGLTLWASSRISADEFAKMGVSTPVVIDREFLISICAAGNP